jgi:hypothetical protein
MVDRIRDEHPEFYDAYHAARRVKALGTRHNKTQPPAPDQSKPADDKKK